MSWRQHHGASPAPVEQEVTDLRFKPGMSGAEVKARAKELRKYAEQRGIMKEAERQKKREAAREQSTPRRPAADGSSPRQPTPRTPEAAGDGDADDERPVCSFFLQGKCGRGARCRFRHALPDAAPDADAARATAPDVVLMLSADLWLLVLVRLPVSAVCSFARCCTTLATVAATPALWAELRVATFGVSADEGVPSGGGAAGDNGAACDGSAARDDGASHDGGAADRRVCCRSEAALLGWCGAAAAAPTELPLAQMSGVAVSGLLGVSTHEMRFLRLWEARTGRRLGCRTLKHAPLAIDAATVGERRSAYDAEGTQPLAVVGDAHGALHVVHLDDELDAPTQRRPFVPRAVAPVVPGDGPHATERGAPSWQGAMCAVLALPWTGGGEGGDGGDGGDGGGGGDGGDGDDDDDHGDDDAQEEGAESDEGAGTLTGDASSARAAVRVVSAHRDGAVVMSVFGPNAAAPQVAWSGTLARDVDGALTFGPALPLGGGAGGGVGGGVGGGAGGDAGGVGGLAALWTADGRMPLVALADGGASTLYTTWNSMACAIDVERGTLRWASGRVGGGVVDAFDALDIGDLGDGMAAPHAPLHLPHGAPPHAAVGVLNGGVGARLACYSPGWRLLAVACQRAVTLWDERTVGPVARVEAPPAGTTAGGASGGGSGGGSGSGGVSGGVSGGGSGEDGGCVHLDSGADGWSGHLLHLPPGANESIHVYDVRRLGRGSRSRAAETVVWLGASAVPLRARIAPSRPGHTLGGCFAAAAGGLVAAGHGSGKAVCSYRWSTARSEARARHGGDGDGVGVADDGEDAEIDAAKAAAKERAAAKKKQRVVTKSGGYKAKKGGTSRTG